MRPLLLLALVAGLACTEPESIEFGQKNAGAPCLQASDCRAGLACTNSVCTPLAPLPEGPQRGDACVSDAQCGPTLVCGRQSVCTTTKGAAAGASCALTESCAAPLVCDGRTGTCAADSQAPGSFDLGAACSELLDCRRPYVCGITGKCERVPLYLGPSCARSDAETGAFRVYFELPPEAPLPADFEFYRLPFPSDLALVDGHPSLAGHPAPEDVLGLSLRDVYFKAVEQDTTGFAPNQPVFFRFSDLVDRASLCLDPGGAFAPDGGGPYCEGSGPATVFLVDVDRDSPQYGARIPVQLASSREAGLYICQNWLGIAPLDGAPLRQGNTYAAVVTTGVRDIRGGAPIPDRDFAAILDGSTPAPAMKPFLDWLADKGVDRATIAGAAVFTTGTPEARAQKIRQAVHRVSPTPTFGAHVTCGGAAVSPCDDGLTGPQHVRGCIGANAAFDVVEGTYEAPAFQGGTRPFKRASDGGAFVSGADGVPVPQGTERMCFAVALPKTPAPAGGFPVVLVGHGTGGSYRTFLRDGTGERLTALGYAVVGIDNVMHGPRQQPPGAAPAPATWSDPGNLFFNLASPRASRDNINQGAADLFHLVRLVRNPATTLNGPNGVVRFRPDRVTYFGHSQGTIVSPAFLAAEPDLQGALLSGAGAELALSLLNKKKPLDSVELARIAFGDRNLSRIHPMMGITAMLFAEADATTYAHRWVRSPELRGAPLPLLQIVGIGDGFTPDLTQHAQLRAAGLPLVGAVDEAIPGVSAIASPARSNVNGVTAGAVQLRPEGDYDGHFVTFNHPKGKAAFTRFFETARAGTPEIAK
jgi:pimeloyl-ACP methyl ester carboxylesterase